MAIPYCLPEWWRAVLRSFLLRLGCIYPFSKQSCQLNLAHHQTWGQRKPSPSALKKKRLWESFLQKDSAFMAKDCILMQCSPSLIRRSDCKWAFVIIVVVLLCWFFSNHYPRLALSIIIIIISRDLWPYLNT